MSAGPGGSICQNNSIQLNASVDNLYAPYQILWTPATGLTDPLTHNATDTILNPIASPGCRIDDIHGAVHANTGCIRTDTVRVNVNGYCPIDTGQSQSNSHLSRATNTTDRDR
jgi:hypothetical protein